MRVASSLAHHKCTIHNEYGIAVKVSPVVQSHLERVGIVGLVRPHTVKAKNLRAGDVLIWPGSSRMCWEVTRPPEASGHRVKIVRCIEIRGGKRMPNRRSFTFRRNERLAVMNRDIGSAV